MAFCRACGTELKETDKFCEKCGTENGVKEIVREVIKEEQESRTFSKAWYVVAFFIPLIGLIAGIIFLAQSRKSSGKLLGFSILLMIIYFFLGLIMSF